jgi:predicted TIM-barrel enzyme
MKKERKRYDGVIKTNVAMEAIRSRRTVNEIAAAYGIHPHHVAHWKKQALEQSPEIFSNGRAQIAERAGAAEDCAAGDAAGTRRQGGRVRSRSSTNNPVKVFAGECARA